MHEWSLQSLRFDGVVSTRLRGKVSSTIRATQLQVSPNRKALGNRARGSGIGGSYLGIEFVYEALSSWTVTQAVSRLLHVYIEPSKSRCCMPL